VSLLIVLHVMTEMTAPLEVGADADTCMDDSMCMCLLQFAGATEEDSCRLPYCHACLHVCVAVAAPTVRCRTRMRAGQIAANLCVLALRAAKFECCRNLGTHATGPPCADTESVTCIHVSHLRSIRQTEAQQRQEVAVFAQGHRKMAGCHGEERERRRER